MKITFISVGPVKRPSIKEALEDYIGRIKRYARVETVEVKAEPARAEAASSLKKEAERIVKRLKRDDFKVVLGLGGRSFTSEEFSRLLGGLLMEGRDVAFVVGGSYGLHGTITGMADLVLTLSPMTLPHELARLVLAEQVYRAFTIMRGEPYSH